MRLPKWNLRLSTAMLMVAAFAMGIAADRWKGRWDHCMARAEFYRAKALESRKEAAVMDGWVKRISQGISEHNRPVSASNLVTFTIYRDNDLSLAVQCETLQAQFERAAFIPFVGLPPEPAVAPLGFAAPYDYYAPLPPPRRGGTGEASGTHESSISRATGFASATPP